jgi:anti-sigma-K factor RskA
LDNLELVFRNRNRVTAEALHGRVEHFGAGEAADQGLVGLFRHFLRDQKRRTAASIPGFATQRPFGLTYNIGISAIPLMGSVSTLSGACTGFASDTYDRYVLGLLDGQERASVDEQIEQRCPACLQGVQRSMNLWLVFANSLEQVEPSADFRARLVRIAELSNRVLTVPKRNRRVREPAILISSLIVISIIVGILVAFTWIAGKQSAHSDAQRANAELGQLQGASAETAVRLKSLVEENAALKQKLHSSGHSDATQKRLEEQLSKAQAAILQYQTSISRDSKQATENTTLVTALSNPGVKLLTFRNAEGTSSTAYAFVIENSKVVFVASKLQVPSAEHQYQLWLVRKDQPRYVAAGIFSPVADTPVVITYDEDKDAISSLAGLLVTEEEINGSYSAPSATKVLETPGAATVAAPTAADTKDTKDNN